jgi:hypothetical protein
VGSDNDFDVVIHDRYRRQVFFAGHEAEVRIAPKFVLEVLIAALALQCQIRPQLHFSARMSPRVDFSANAEVQRAVTADQRGHQPPQRVESEVAFDNTAFPREFKNVNDEGAG